MLSSTPYECPPGLLISAKQQAPLKTAVVNAGTILVMTSAKLAAENGLIIPVLVGDANAINSIAADINWNIRNIDVVDANDEIKSIKLSVTLAREGNVSALMKGHVHSDALMREVVHRTNGIRSKRRPSHAFYMTVPGDERGICITDAVINVSPKVRHKIDIARNATDLMHALGNPNPRIAIISGTEVPTDQMPSSIDAIEIVKEAKNGAIYGADIDGPMALDVAISEQAAATKGIDSSVAGKADILLVPNLETGNALFKMMEYFLSATAAGLVLGVKVPITLTSRSSSPESRLASVAIASIYAAHCNTGK